MNTKPTKDQLFLAMHAKRITTVRRVLREEIEAYLTTLSTGVKDSWPDIPAVELTEALADAIISMGRKQGLGTALLQTMIYELQERVNADVAKPIKSRETHKPR